METEISESMSLQKVQVVSNISQGAWYLASEVIETQITARKQILLMKLAIDWLFFLF
jgi:hypothetical protein